MAFVGVVASLASAAVGAIGAIQQGNAQAAAANYNAQVQEQNAKTAQDQAASVAGQKIRESRQKLAAGRAAVMQSGFEVSGSPLDVLDQAETQGYLDYLTAIYDGKVAATGYRNNAQLLKTEAKNAKTAGTIGAATNILSGLSDVYRNRGSVQMGV